METRKTPLQAAGGPIQYWYTLWVVAAVGVFSALGAQFLGYRAAGFFFLCMLLSLGLVFSLGPVLFGALLSALAWDYFFIPPRYTLQISTSEDALMIAAYFLSAAITGLLTGRIRRNQAQLEERERATQILYRLATAFASGGSEKNLRDSEQVLAGAMGRDFMILVAGKDGRLQAPQRDSQPFQVWDEAMALAAKALQSRRAAGWGSTQEPDFPFLILPLRGSRDAYGVMIMRGGGTAQSPAEAEILDSAALRLGLALEREALERSVREAGMLRESELLHQALLNSISHELRTPLTALLGSAQALQDDAVASDPSRRRSLLVELGGAGERLNRVIENLLDMARLSSGVLALKKEWQDPAELAAITAGRLKSPLSGHRLKLDLPEGLPLIHVDYRLIEHALANLLLNAAAYSPEGGEITLSARASGGSVEFSVCDQGRGMPQESLPRLFDKFYRVPGSPAGGTGLGLYIAQSLMQAHGGSASAGNRPGGGAEFVLRLPVEAQPKAPEQA